MNLEIKQILEKIEKNGYEAYVVGGFVRDYFLHRQTNDIDICTNALPKEIQKMFGTSRKLGNYGSYNVKTKQFNFDITTYRNESNFENRNPKTIIYTKELFEDLKRRDFTINAICMNRFEQIIDPYHGQEDIEKKQIRMIGDPQKRLKEDPLRILRAIRFAGLLGFTIQPDLQKSIIAQKEQLKTISDYHIKRELSAIFISENFQACLDLFDQYGIWQYLPIQKSKMNYVPDLNGMWAQVNLTKQLPFTKMELRQINQIKEILKLNSIHAWTIYQYGLYPTSIAAKIQNQNEDGLKKLYQRMPIHERKDLAISFLEIKDLTHASNPEVKEMENQLIQAIFEEKVPNDHEKIIEYIKEVMK